RAALLVAAALLPPLGFAWAGRELASLRPARQGRPAAWETSLLLGAGALALALLLRAAVLLQLAWTASPAVGGPLHAALLVLELDGFLLATTFAVQLRLLPSLARTAPAPGWAAPLGVALLAAAV